MSLFKINQKSEIGPKIVLRINVIKKYLSVAQVYNITFIKPENVSCKEAISVINILRDLVGFLYDIEFVTWKILHYKAKIDRIAHYKKYLSILQCYNVPGMVF